MARRKGRGNKAVTVKSHVRTPRGPNAGKSAVRVHGYKRKKPKNKR